MELLVLNWTAFDILPEIICVLLQYISCLHVHNAVLAITFCKLNFMMKIYEQSFIAGENKDNAHWYKHV